MFHIEADTEVITGGVTYRVLQAVDAEEHDLVETYRDGDEAKTSIGAFQAFFVVNGYNIGEDNPQEG